MKSSAVNIIDAYRQYKWSSSRSDWLLLLGALGLAVIFGAISTFLPPLMLLVTMAALVLFCFAVAKPYLGLLGALMLVFNVVPLDWQPSFGTLRAYDIMVIILAVVLLLRAVGRTEVVLQKLGSIIWPLAYLIFSFGVSIFYVRYYVPNELVFSEARNQFMWLLLLLMVLGIDSRERFKYFVIGAVVIGVTIAVYVTLESMLNVDIMGAGRSTALDVYSNSDIVRSTAGGSIYILIFSLYLCINMMLERRLKLIAGLPLALILCLGLAVQYGRGIWVATLLGLLVSSKIYRGWMGIVKVLVVTVISLAVFIGGIYVVKPRVGEALVERATGIGDELESGGSFGYRKMENRYALAAIEKHPYMGVGVGGIYKPTVTAASFGFSIETTYIHNAWLYFPLKMGLWAAFIPVVFIICFYLEVYRGIKYQPGEIDSGSAFIGAVAGAFLVPVVTSYTQPEWGDPQGVAALAVLTGCALLYRRWGSPFPGAMPPAVGP